MGSNATRIAYQTPLIRQEYNLRNIVSNSGLFASLIIASNRFILHATSTRRQQEEKKKILSIETRMQNELCQFELLKYIIGLDLNSLERCPLRQINVQPTIREINFQ